MTFLQYFNFLLTEFNRSLTHCLIRPGVSLWQKQLKIETMNNVLSIFIFAGFAVVFFSSGAFAQNESDTTKVSGTHHIKLLKIENGKKTELDTVLTADDFFVWDGDTINPEEGPEMFRHAGFGKKHHFGMNVEERDGKRIMTVRRLEKDDEDEPLFFKFDLDDDFPMFSDNDKEPARKSICIHKRMKDGDPEASAWMDQQGSRHFCPGCLEVPGSMMKVEGGRRAGHLIDLNDPAIISYKKKKLSGGREKIEIVRKKSDSDDLSFDLTMDDQLDVPEPPDAVKQIDCDGHKFKVHEKKATVNGKPGKEYKVEVTTEENK